MSNTSMPANFWNSMPLPSITGLAASGPMLPRPSTAVPLVITATRLPRAVSSRGLVGIGDDRLAGGGDARRIRQRQVALGHHRLGRRDLDLARARQAVVFERGKTQFFGEGHECAFSMKESRTPTWRRLVVMLAPAHRSGPPLHGA